LYRGLPGKQWFYIFAAMKHEMSYMPTIELYNCSWAHFDLVTGGKDPETVRRTQNSYTKLYSRQQTHNRHTTDKQSRLFSRDENHSVERQLRKQKESRESRAYSRGQGQKAMAMQGRGVAKK